MASLMGHIRPEVPSLITNYTSTRQTIRTSETLILKTSTDGPHQNRGQYGKLTIITLRYLLAVAKYLHVQSYHFRTNEPS